MKVLMEFELPFAECSKCDAFQPVVEKPCYEADVDKKTITFSRTLTCKGYRFCKYLKENVLGG